MSFGNRGEGLFADIERINAKDDWLLCFLLSKVRVNFDSIWVCI